MDKETRRAYLAEIQPANQEAMARARAREEALAKPPGSLGSLEDMAVKLAGIRGQVKNRIEKPCIIILSADNGVVEEGVASAPQSVTLMQTINFMRRVTGVGSLAKNFGVDLLVLDMGINAQVPAELSSKDMADYGEKIIDRKVAYGTANLAKGAAMSEEEFWQAFDAGIESVHFAKSQGYDAIGVGEMGIGNTTTSACVLGVLEKLEIDEVVGRGGGLTDAAYNRKKEIVKEILAEFHNEGPSPASGAETHNNEPFSASLAKAHDDVPALITRAGGFDIASMMGVFIGAAHEKLPVVIDGFISITAALAAARLVPVAKEYMFASHKSFERGYMKAAEALELTPFLDLGMRLGEGSGCVPAFQILRAACAVINDMATFEEAKIDDGYLEEIRKGGCF